MQLYYQLQLHLKQLAASVGEPGALHCYDIHTYTPLDEEGSSHYGEQAKFTAAATETKLRPSRRIMSRRPAMSPPLG